MAGLTEHYELRKPAETDHVNVITDINDNMDTLDATVFGIEGTANSALQPADVVNNLTTTDNDAPLSATQGKALQDNKANKASSPTVDHISTLDASGNPKDSGKTLDSYSAVTHKKNYFNKDTAVPGYYVLYTTGALVANASYHASDYIEVVAGEVYHRTYVHQMAFYNSSKVFISGFNTGNNLTAPAGAVYARFTIINASVDTFQVELGNEFTGYEAYTYELSTLSNDGIPIDPIPDKHIGIGKFNFSVSKNLFNKADIRESYYVVYTTGLLQANGTYDASAFIEVEAGETYYRTFAHQMAFYDADKVYVSGLQATDGNVFIVPAGVAYARFTVIKTALDTFQVEKGWFFSGYEDYELKVPQNSVLNGKDEIYIFLPSEICAAVGRTIELYNRQVVWCRNIENFNIVWVCDKGYNMKRKFSYTAISGDIGTYTLTCKIYGRNMTYLTEASTTLNVVSATISTPFTVCPIGDSLTNSKAWLGEARTLSGDDISFVGTRWGGDVEGGYLNHEGRSGVAASWYLANGTYTFDANGVSSANPFYDPVAGHFSWSYYKTTYSKNPDSVMIWLGTNGIALDPTANAGNIKQIIDYIRADDTTIPIFVAFTLYQANQDGILTSGVWKSAEDRKVFNLMVQLYALLSAYSDLHFMPLGLCHDSEYNFGSVATPVNPRASQTENLPIAGTNPHPQNQGYMQCADIVFSSLAAYQP